MRPIQALGLNEDGIHRFLFTESRDGDLYMNRKMFALEYGTDLASFTVGLDRLLEDGRIVSRRPESNSRLESFLITEPAGYDSNDQALGSRDTGWTIKRIDLLNINPYIRKPGQSAEEASDLIEAYESLEEECLDLLDEVDLDEEAS
jgi:hypothetical protein